MFILRISLKAKFFNLAFFYTPGVRDKRGLGEFGRNVSSSLRLKTVVFLIIICLFSWKALFCQIGHKLQYKSQTNEIMYEFSTYGEGVQETEGSRIVSQRSMRGLVSFRFVGETAQQLMVEMVYDSLEIYAVSELEETTIKDPPEVIGLLIKKVLARSGDQLSSVELNEFGIMPASVSFSTQNEFLTNLPDKPIFENQTFKMIDRDTVFIASGACLNNMDLEYKFSGKEMALGYNCVKLTVNGKAKISGDFSRQGTQFLISGEGAIIGTILFSPEKGLLVSSSNETKLHLNILTSGNQPISIPVIQTSRSEINLFQ